jgi:hypothetical protein
MLLDWTSTLRYATCLLDLFFKEPNSPTLRLGLLRWSHYRFAKLFERFLNDSQGNPSRRELSLVFLSVRVFGGCLCIHWVIDVNGLYEALRCDLFRSQFCGIFCW